MFRVFGKQCAGGVSFLNDGHIDTVASPRWMILYSLSNPAAEDSILATSTAFACSIPTNVSACCTEKFSQICFGFFKLKILI